MVEFLKSKDIDKAITFANKTATCVVQKRGVSVVTCKELEELEILDDLFVCRNCSEEELKTIMEQ